MDDKKKTIKDIQVDPFEEYIRHGEPDKAEKAYVWNTAVGLQDVDKLSPSEYLLNTAKDNIEGEITMDEAKRRIDSYYQESKGHQPERTEEADKVSVRIAEILSESHLSFRLLSIFLFIGDCFWVFILMQAKSGTMTFQKKNGYLMALL